MKLTQLTQYANASLLHECENQAPNHTIPLCERENSYANAETSLQTLREHVTNYANANIKAPSFQNTLSYCDPPFAIALLIRGIRKPAMRTHLKWFETTPKHTWSLGDPVQSYEQVKIPYPNLFQGSKHKNYDKPIIKDQIHLLTFNIQTSPNTWESSLEILNYNQTSCTSSNKLNKTIKNSRTPTGTR